MSKFVEKCCRDNITAPKDMANVALERIKEIDKEIFRLSDLQAERKNLMEVIGTFNPTSIAKEVIYSDAPEANLIQNTILMLIDQTEPSVDDLILNIGAEWKSNIFFNIKHLGEAGIIVRRNTDHRFIKGPNWSNKNA